ncbi:Uncharacterised protein [Candidatus Burarchaeum australiense]|nr:Uncharacterised protein [Candidatus Burarchaeum australiense]
MAASASSPVLIERLPTDYNDFWSAWWAPQVFASSQLLSELSRLHLEKVNTTEPALIFSSEERKEFSKAIEGYAAARASANSSKVWAQDASFYSSGISLPFPQLVPLCYVVYYKEVMPRIQASFSYAREALISSNEATNLALEVVLEKTAELDYMGAGYAGYAGAASGPYSEVRDLLVQANNTELGAVRHSDAARRYSTVLTASKDVRSAFAKSNAQFNDSLAYANALNYQLAGDDNLLALMVGLYRKLSLAEDAMNAEYEAMKADSSRRLDSYGGELSHLRSDEKYSLVDSNLVSKIMPFSGASVNPPAQRLSSAQERMDGIGLDDDAKGLYDGAISTYRMQSQNYAGVAFEKLTKCRRMLDEISLEIAQAKRDVADMLPVAQSQAEEERGKAELALASFSPKTETEANLKASALAFTAEADSLLAEASSTNSDGLALSKYAEATGKYADAREMLSKDSVQLETKKVEAERAVGDLREAIALAGKDGVETEFESDQLALLEAQLKVADAPLHASIIELASELKEGLLARAKLSYADLEETHASLANDFSLIAQVGMPEGLRDDYSAFLELDSAYFDGARLSDDSLGHLSEMRSSLERIMTSVDSYRKGVLEDYLSAHASFTMQSDEVPLLDLPCNFTLALSMPNGLPFGSDGRSTIEVPLPYDVSSEDMVGFTDNVLDVAYAKGKLTILFGSIPPASISTVLFSKSATLAETKSFKENTLSLSPLLLRRERLVQFTSLPVDALRARIPLGSQPSRLDAYLDGVPVQAELISENGSLFAEALMKGVSAGSHTLRFYYEFETPYSITQSNRSIETSGERSTVSFDLTLASTGEELSNVPAYFTDASNASINSKDVSVIGYSEPPASLKIFPSEFGLSLTWNAPLLRPGSPLVYHVQYSFNDLASYVESLYASLSASPTVSDAYAARFTRIRGLMDTGHYDTAVDELLALQQELSAPSVAGVSGTAMPDRFSQELALFKEEEANANEAVSAIAELSPETALTEIYQRLARASQGRQEAETLAAEGKYSEALSKLAAARPSLQGLPILKHFNLFRSSLENNVQASKVEALKVGLLADVNGSLVLLSNASALLSSAQVRASAADWSEAFSLLHSANVTLSSATGSLRATELSIISDFGDIASAYAAKKQNVSSLLTALSKAMTFTLGTGEVPKSKLSLSFDLAALQRSMEDEEKTFDTVEKSLDPANPSALAAKVQDIERARTSIDSLLSSEELLREGQAELQRKASLSYDNARLSVKQLSELAPRGVAQYSDEISHLSNLLADSETALESGRLLDSISISSHISSRTVTALDKLPPSSPGSGSLLSGNTIIIGISLLFFAALIYLFAGRKPPKEAHALHKLAQATQDESLF